MAPSRRRCRVVALRGSAQPLVVPLLVIGMVLRRRRCRRDGSAYDRSVASTPAKPNGQKLARARSTIRPGRQPGRDDNRGQRREAVHGAASSPGLDRGDPKAPRRAIFLVADRVLRHVARGDPPSRWRAARCGAKVASWLVRPSDYEATPRRRRGGAQPQSGAAGSPGIVVRIDGVAKRPCHCPRERCGRMDLR